MFNQSTTIDLQDSHQEHLTSSDYIQTTEPHATKPIHHESLPTNSQRKTQVRHQSTTNLHTAKGQTNPKTTKTQGTYMTLSTKQEEKLPTGLTAHPQPRRILPTNQNE